MPIFNKYNLNFFLCCNLQFLGVKNVMVQCKKSPKQLLGPFSCNVGFFLHCGLFLALWAFLFHQSGKFEHNFVIVFSKLSQLKLFSLLGNILKKNHFEAIFRLNYVLQTNFFYKFYCCKQSLNGFYFPPPIHPPIHPCMNMVFGFCLIYY